MEGSERPAPPRQLIPESMSLPTRRFVASPNKIGPYYLRAKIGEGGFSRIRIATDELGREYACKIVSKLFGSEVHTMIEREIEIHSKLKYPTICRWYDVVQDSLNYYIIMELCKGSSLYDFIARNGKVEEDSARIIFRGLCEAVGHIHSLRIAHRDIKPENIVVDDSLHVKLIDFGLSEMCAGLSTSTSGSCSYQSPEILNGLACDSMKADMWALGVVLYTMVIGHLPWTRRTRNEVIQQIRDCHFFVPVSVSEPCRAAIMGMMNPDCEKRWSINEALNCDWLTGVKAPRLPVPPAPERVVKERPFFQAPEREPKLEDAKTILKEAKRRVPISGKAILASRGLTSSFIKKPQVGASLCWRFSTGW